MSVLDRAQRARVVSRCDRRSDRKQPLCWLAGALLTVLPVVSLAQDISIYDEQGKLLRGNERVSTLGTDLFGDQVSLYTGSLEFVQTDVSLPGNNALPVSVGRRFTVGANGMRNGHFGDWDLEIPRAHGVFARGTLLSGWNSNGSAQRCSQYGAPARVSYTPPGGTAASYDAWNFWQGNFIYLPGAGDQEILQRAAGNTQAPGGVPSNYPLVTKSGGMIQCIPLASGTGEGFLLTTPDGTQYRFDVMLSRDTQGLKGGMSTERGGDGDEEPPPPTEGTQVVLPRQEVWIVPSRVTDRYGNYVTYNWNGWQLTSMVATSIDASKPDGRTLTFTYHPSTNLIKNVTATVQSGGFGSSRIWTYSYGTGLTSITQPDASTWTFNLAPLYEQLEMSQPSQSSCNGPAPASWENHEGTMTHPSGATGAFRVTELNHGRTWVKRACQNVLNGNIIPGTWSLDPREFPVLSLTRKKIEGSGLPSGGYTWVYAYDTSTGNNPSSCWDPAGTAQPVVLPNDTLACTSSSPTTKTVEVTDPHGDVLRYTYGIRSEVNDGQLLNTEVLRGGVVKQSVAREYQSEANSGGLGFSIPWPSPYGTSIQARGNQYMATHLLPEKRRLTVQDGSSFEWVVQLFDSRARPLQVARNRVLVAGASITEKTTYHDNTTKWVLGQVAKVEARQSISSGAWEVPVENTYDATTAVLTQQKRFGQTHRTYGWNTDGTLAWSRDGLTQQTSYSNYKRGVPRRIDYANGNWIEADVNDTGEIEKVRQPDNSNVGAFTQYEVAYGYDGLGRLYTITPPAGDTLPNGATTWNPTILTFVPTTSSEYGLTGTHWRQTVRTGDTVNGFLETVTYFDALWRPVLTSRHGTNGAGTVNTNRRMTRMEYDANGRTTFESYPRASIASITDASAVGTTTTYDALGRAWTITAATETQLYPTVGASTTTITYLTGFRKRVQSPNGFVTTTDFQAYDTPSEDAPTAITDNLVSTTLTRDVFGKVTQLTRGSTAAGVRNFVYDAQHRLCMRVDPESLATVFAYDAAGNLAWQASGQNLSSSTTCENARTSVAASAKIVHGYDSRNRLTQTTYGDGSPTVSRSWTPDNRPLQTTSGQSTWTYKYNRRRLLLEETLSLSGTGGGTNKLEYEYTVNGSLNRMRYPNGTWVAYAPNLFGEPTQVGTYATQVIYHPNGGLNGFVYGNNIGHGTTQNVRGLPWQTTDGSEIDREYRYDLNGNVTWIDDKLVSNEDRRLSYDGRDRLTIANYVNWSSSFEYVYDDLDNIKWQRTPSNFNPSQMGRNFEYKYDSRGRLYEVEDHAYPAGEDRYHRYAYNTSFGGDRGNVTRRKLAWLINVDQDYLYNLANQMKEVRDHNTLATLATYEYDGNGRRVRMTEGTTRRLQMYNQAGQLVYETTNVGGVPGDTTEFVYLGRHLIAERKNGSTLTYVHTDALGSVTRKTDALGVRVQDRVYEPFGESLEVTTRAPQWPQGMAYTGHVLDNLTRVTYAQARYYDQLMGRFMSVDPVAPDAGSFNRYWYANNNPYKYFDPDGRCAKVTGSHICGGGTGAANARMIRFVDDGSNEGGGAEVDITECRTAGCTNPALADAAKKTAEAASEIADVVDEQATDPTNYLLGPLLKAMGWGAKAGMGVIFKTTKEAAAAAEKLGFRKINETIKGQAIFTDGKLFITRDIDSHNGGAWKMADSVANLGSRQTRMGTFDAQLNKIGP
jgi:RHS repeat-associated protein